jgi:hypothetical protein
VCGRTFVRKIREGAQGTGRLLRELLVMRLMISRFGSSPLSIPVFRLSAACSHPSGMDRPLWAAKCQDFSGSVSPLALYQPADISLNRLLIAWGEGKEFDTHAVRSLQAHNLCARPKRLAALRHREP